MSEHRIDADRVRANLPRIMRGDKAAFEETMSQASREDCDTCTSGKEAAYVSSLETVAEVAAMGEGMECPRCHRQCKLFYGDPDGEHWCALCEAEDVFGLEKP